MKNLLLLISIIWLTNPLAAQNYSWAIELDARADCHVKLVKYDEKGNTVIAGQFNDVVDFDPSPALFNLVPNNGNSNLYNSFVAKYDYNGKLLWAQFISSTSDNKVNDLAIDSSGNIYLTGGFSGIADFDMGSGTDARTSNSTLSAENLYLCKIDSNGKKIWTYTTTATMFSAGQQVRVRDNGTVYLAAYGNGEMDLDPGPNTVSFNPSIPNGFLLTIDKSGNYSASFTGLGRELWDMEIDGAGNFYVGGNFRDTFDFDPGIAVVNKIAQGKRDAYVAKYAANGSFQWVQTLGGKENDYCDHIELDQNGFIYQFGRIADSVDLNPNGSPIPYKSYGSSPDLYLRKLSPSGSVLWAKPIRGFNQKIPSGMRVGSSIYLATHFLSWIAPDISNQGDTLFSNGSYDGLVMQWGLDGQYKTSFQFGSTEFDYFGQIDLWGNQLLMPGSTTSSIDLDPTSGTDIHTPTQTKIGFVSSFSFCDSNTYSVSINSCGDYKAGNGITYTKSGNYRIIYSTPSGCDSLVSMDLTITNLNPTVTQIGNIFQCDVMADSYTWMECVNNKPIPGANTKSIKPNLDSIDGVKVLVIKNGCSFISECYHIWTGVIQVNTRHDLNIYPNPNKGSFTLSWDQEIPDAQIQIYSAQGVLVYEKQLENSEQTDLYLSLPKGIYLAIVKSPDVRRSARLVIH